MTIRSTLAGATSSDSILLMRSPAAKRLSQNSLCGKLLSDEREIQQNSCEQLVGNAVNVQAASYTNDIGQALLGAWWRDPDFDATQTGEDSAGSRSRIPLSI